jgi:hypothetical protein
VGRFFLIAQASACVLLTFDIATEHRLKPVLLFGAKQIDEIEITRTGAKFRDKASGCATSMDSAVFFAAVLHSRTGTDGNRSRHV